MTTRTHTLSSAILLALFLAACGGEGEVGESCDDPGSKDACVAGAICTNESGSEATCRELCDEHADCPNGYKCSGVTDGNAKSCQPSDDEDATRPDAGGKAK